MKTSQKIWILLGACTLLLRWVAAARPDWTERLYSRGLFVAIRNAIDYGFAWLPFPLAYIFIPGVLIWLGISVRRWWRRRDTIWEKFKSAVAGMLAFLGGMVFFFFFLWGFNYSRIPLEQQLDLQPKPLTTEELREEFDLATTALIAARMRIPGASDAALDYQPSARPLEQQLRGEVAAWLQSHGYYAGGRVRGRQLYPKGALLRFGTAGIYFPFTGEGHADAGLHPLQLPSVLAHELAHGFGFGDEGVCNYIAYAACVHSRDPVIAYASILSFWRTLAAQYRARRPDEYRQLRGALPAGILADMDAINQTMLAYPDIFPRFRDAAYNTYLKAQGVQEGMLSYDKVVMLVRAERLLAAGR